MERPALLAGAWYPADEDACRAAVRRHAKGTEPEGTGYRGLVGPHAGWTYSGDCAGRAYKWLAASGDDRDLVVVFGSHRGPEGPNTVLLADGWQTPLGPLRTARLLADEIASELGLLEEPIQPLRPDNGAELHMPFVRHFFPRADLLMLGVAASETATTIGQRVGEIVRAASRDAVFVGSTDLTHYGPNYAFAPAGDGPAAVQWVRDENDRGFLDAVLAADSRGVVAHAASHSSACCSGAVAAVLEAVRAYSGRCEPRLVDHYLSCDVVPSSSFVGYAGLVL